MSNLANLTRTRRLTLIAGLALALTLLVAVLGGRAQANTPLVLQAANLSDCSGSYYPTSGHSFEAVLRGPDGGWAKWSVHTTIPGHTYSSGTYAKMGDQVQDIPVPISSILSIRASVNLGLTWCTLTRTARP